MILLSVGAVVVTACERLVKLTPQILPTVQPLETGTMTPTDSPSQTPKPTASLSPTTTHTPSPCMRLLTPENGEQLSATGKTTFMWEIVPGAAYYELRITLPSQQPVMFRTEGNSRDQYLEAFWMGGRYGWMVTAFDHNGSVLCNSDIFTFEKEETSSTVPLTTPTLPEGDGSDSSSDSPESGSSSDSASGSWSTGSDD
jgi:hypothetical protein